MSNLRYADDTTLLATSLDELSTLLHKVKLESEALCLFLNVTKTKLMTISTVRPGHPLLVDGEEIERVSQFNFLGSRITETGGCKEEI